jgi:hypothetical protein
MAGKVNGKRSKAKAVYKKGAGLPAPKTLP